LLICDSHRGLMRYDPATDTLETLVAEVAGRALTFWLWLGRIGGPGICYLDL
jgi:hypothetical protein